MADQERLPIRFFSPRDVDNLRVEGGGSLTGPRWMLSEEELEMRSRSLVQSVEGFKATVTRKEVEQTLIPLVIKARISNDASAKSHRREVTRLFQIRNKNNVLGLADTDEIIIKLESSKDADAMIEKLKDTDGYARALSAVQSISEFVPIVSTSDKPDDYKVKLIDYQDYEQNVAIGNYFEAAMRKLGLSIKKTYYSPEHIVYNVKSIDVDSLNEIQGNDAFEAVFSMEPMPKYTVSLDAIPSGEDVEIIAPEEGRKYVTVGILDNGIADIPHLQPWVVDRWSPYPDDIRARDHGPFVSGVLVYGDQLEGQDWIGTKGLKVFDACVFPDTTKESVSEDELIANS